MSSPLVSILTPFKNTASYINACIDSIVVQDYTNWELIIIDDGSEDQSHSIVNKYAKKDQRIKLHKSNGEGIIDALKLAFKISAGELITRMDSDDIMKPNKLQVMVNKLLHHGQGHIAVGQVQYFSDEDISNGYARYEAWLNELTEKGTNYSEIYKECVIPSPCWMVWREDLITCNAFNPNRYPEDYDLTFRFYEHNIRCIPCDSVLHLWRDYSTRTSRTHVHYAQNYFLDIKLHYFLKLNYDKKRPLAVWGAGFKGKTIAKRLAERNIPFYWICDNPKKIGRDIYGITLHNFDYLSKLQLPQSIVTVANETEQSTIKQYFENQDMKSMIDYFFFC